MNNFKNENKSPFSSPLSVKWLHGKNKTTAVNFKFQDIPKTSSRFFNKVKGYVTFTHCFIRKYFSITVVIYFIYSCYKNDYHLITKSPLFIVMLTITLMVQLYSIWKNNEINYGLREKFEQFISMIKNPLTLMLILIIAFFIRICIRYYFCGDFEGFYLVFLVIYITILPIKYFTYIIMYTIKKGFNINLLHEGIIFSFMRFNEHITLCIIQYSIITLFKYNVPFVILFKWSEIDYNNIGKFVYNNKELLIRGNIIKINFEYLLLEIKKLVPYVYLQYKYSLNIGPEHVIGRNILVRKSDYLNADIKEYPCNEVFDPLIPKYTPRRDNLQFAPGIIMTRNKYSIIINDEFSTLSRCTKLNEPVLANPFHLNYLQAIFNVPGPQPGVYGQNFPIVNPTKDFFHNFFQHHHNFTPLGDKNVMHQGIRYLIKDGHKPFLIVNIDWSIEKAGYINEFKHLRGLYKMASENYAVTGISRGNSGDNKFLVSVQPGMFTFYIYQKNILRDVEGMVYKPAMAQSLVCIVWDGQRIACAPQTKDGRINVIPYSIRYNCNSIMTIINYMATCSTVPTLESVNNNLVINTPPSKPSVVEEVKRLDAFNTIRSNGTITNSNPAQVIKAEDGQVIKLEDNN
jgi:hypothetical protein